MIQRLNGKSVNSKCRAHNYDINKNKIKISNIQQKQSFDSNILINDEQLPLPKLTFKQASTIVASVSLLCFWNAQYASFTFDDNSAILKNKDLRAETSIWKLFENDFWGTDIQSNISHKSYRPLTVLTFRLNYYLSEGLHPWGFHFVNILLHALHSVLLLRLFSILIGGINTDKNGNPIFSAPKASLLCSVLFAVHPIHAESVAAVVGRADLICGIFICLSFILYVDHTQKGLLLSIVCAAVAMFSKEQGITVLGLCIAYEVIMVLKINPQIIRSWMHQRETNLQSTSIKRIVVLLMSAVFLLALRVGIMASPPPSFQYNDNPHSFQNSTIMRVLNYNYLYSLNLWLLLVPWWLCFDWAMGCIPVIETFVDLRLLAPLFMWIIIVISVTKLLAMLDSHLGRCVAMSLAFLVIPFLPAMNIFFRVGFVIAERNLYISSIGFVMMVTLGMVMLSTKTRGMIVTVGMWILISISIWRCIQRTNDWLTEESLFQSGLNVCPLNAKVHYNVGKNFQDRGKDDEAIQYYLEAIRLSPEYDQAMNNLGNIYKDKKMLREAEYYNQMSVKVNPKFATGWMNLGTVKAELKQKEEAIRCYEEAIKHRRKYPDAYYNWGNLHVEFKEFELAIDKYKKAINLKNDHQQSWQNMIMALGESGKGDELIIAATKVMKIFPGDPEVIYLLGNSLGKAEKIMEAEPYMKESIKLQPDSSNAHGNIAVLYHRSDRYEEAAKHYIEAVRLDPKNTFAEQNYNKLLRVWKQ